MFRRVKGILFLVFLMMFCCAKLRAQTYYFTNYGLKQGLSQSQVNVIFQAKNHTLWLGTYGGISNFNGINFISYSKAEGLSSGMINCITETNGEQIVLGTDVGVTTIVNDTIRNFATTKRVTNLVTDTYGKVWGISGTTIFWFKNGKFTWVKADGLDRAGMLTKDAQGQLYAYFYGKGLFRLNGLKWSLYAVLPANDVVLRVGFECASSFIRLFRSKYHTTPLKYKKQFAN